MFYLRLNKVKIYDNGKFAFMKKRDKTTVQLVSLINNGAGDLPTLTDLIEDNSEEGKKKALDAAVKNSVYSRVLSKIENIKDNHEFTFGDAGYVVYSSSSVPDLLNWQFLAIGDRKTMRTKAQIYKDILESDGYPGFQDDVLSLVTTVASPVTSAAIEIGEFVARTILGLYAESQDKQLGLYYTSLVRQQDYPYVNRKGLDESDLSGNMKIDYEIFGFE